MSRARSRTLGQTARFVIFVFAVAAISTVYVLATLA